MDFSGHVDVVGGKGAWRGRKKWGRGARGLGGITLACLAGMIYLWVGGRMKYAVSYVRSFAHYEWTRPLCAFTPRSKPGQSPGYPSPKRYGMSKLHSAKQGMPTNDLTRTIPSERADMEQSVAWVYYPPCILCVSAEPPLDQSLITHHVRSPTPAPIYVSIKTCLLLHGLL